MGNKLKYWLTVCIFLSVCIGACKKENSVVDTTDKQPDVSENIQIEKALLLDPLKVSQKEYDMQIFNTLIKYVNATPAEADIYISIYTFDYLPLIKALKDAYTKGVNIHLLIDDNPTSEGTIAEFQNFLKTPSEIIKVDNDNTPDAINHEKYILFSELDLPEGVAKNVVFGTSHNFGLGAAKKVNDAVIMTNKKLYGYFKNNWQEVASRAAFGMKNFTYAKNNVGDSISAMFFPMRSGGKWIGKDPILETLGELSDFDKDTIRVMMAFFTRLPVAEALTALQNAEVTVQVITRMAGGQGVSDEVMAELKKLKQAGGYVKILDISKQNLHSKCMLIKGTWKGEPTTLILTGSHNYTNYALKYNNEFLLMLKNSALFKDYWNYYSRLQLVLNDYSGWGD